MLKSILIVDDSRIIRTLLSDIISIYFKEINIIKETSNGLEAIQLLEKTQFDLIFLDIHMPKLGGLKTLEKIKEKFGDHHPPIIVISADGSEKNLIECNKFGAEYFLKKPFTPEKIVEYVSYFKEKYAKKQNEDRHGINL